MMAESSSISWADSAAGRSGATGLFVVPCKIGVITKFSVIEVRDKVKSIEVSSRRGRERGELALA
jgi:hypothetical protein